MLLNVSYNDPKTKAKIEEEVGKPFGIIERLKLKGVGSPKLFITTTSADIHNLLMLDKYINSCNIEMRPKGIIVRFRSILETYALIIPHYKLSLYKGKAEEYSIYRDHHFIKIKARATNSGIHGFMKKILAHKADNVPTSINDL